MFIFECFEGHITGFFTPKICLNLNGEVGMMSNEKKDVVVVELCASKEAGAENLSGRENRYCYD